MHITINPLRNKAIAFLALVLFMLLASPGAYAQRIALKTNALEYLALSPNLTLEARMSRHISIQLGVAANPIAKPIADYKLTNFRVEPEVRYWFNRPMARHFVALSMTAGMYSFRFKDQFYMGDIYAAGVSYGYALVLSRHWNMEMEIGVGLGSTKGYDYKGLDNRPPKPNYTKLIPVPIRCGLSFAYVFK